MFDGLSFDFCRLGADNAGREDFCFLSVKPMARLVLAMVAVVTAFTLWMAPVAQAADLGHGGQIFANNCAACHVGGGNVVNGAKTLKQADLETYGMASVEAIATQVTNGKNAMPAFKGRFSSEDIADVAAYVLSQAEQGW
jgi:cytochrome c6